MDFAPDSIITPDQEVSTFDFAQGEDANSVLDADNSRRGPETYQRESTHRPTLSFGSVSRDLPGLSPDFRKFDVTGGSHHSHKITYAPCSSPASQDLDVPDGLHNQSLFGGVTQQATSYPEWLDRIVEAALVRVCQADTTYAFYVPHDRRGRHVW